MANKAERIFLYSLKGKCIKKGRKYFLSYGKDSVPVEWLFFDQPAFLNGNDNEAASVHKRTRDLSVLLQIIVLFQ
jgi:hypothetical protein